MMLRKWSQTQQQNAFDNQIITGLTLDPKDPCTIHASLVVAQVYDTKAELITVVKEEAIKHGFETSVLSSNKSRYSVRCKHEDCKWRIHGRRLHKAIPEFVLGAASLVHTCPGSGHVGHKDATAKVVSDLMTAKWKHNSDYSPGDAARDFLDEHGIQLPYHRVWRALEIVKVTIFGTEEENYADLPAYCRKLVDKNPNSSAFVEDENGAFSRVFLSYGACLSGFAHCRPLLGLDSTHLKGKYGGSLLVASGVDANGSLFPIAVAVVRSEDYQNWLWFLDKLKICFDERQLSTPQTIISAHQNGLPDAVSIVFKDSFHAWCLNHLRENFKIDFKNAVLQILFNKLIVAPNPRSFDQIMDDISRISVEAEVWLRRNDPRHWSMAYLLGKRYGHYTSNICKSLNSQLDKARESPIIFLLREIGIVICDWFVERRDKGLCEEGLLTSHHEKELSIVLEQSCDFQTRKIDTHEYEVFDSRVCHIVNVQNQSCSCETLEEHGLPCSHAAAVIVAKRQQLSDSAESYLRLESYRSTYSGVIRPVEDRSLWDSIDFEEKDNRLMPPKTSRPPGRPRKRRIRAEEQGRLKRVFTCSRCKGKGHSRRTCEEPI